MHLINDDWTINPHLWFEIPNKKNKGKRLKISGSIENGRLYETIDVVKNIDTGKYIKLERGELKTLKPVIFRPIERDGCVKKNSKKELNQLYIEDRIILRRGVNCDKLIFLNNKTKNK